MYKNILVPMDLSDKHDQAVKLAAEMVRASQGRVTLFHVVQIIQGLPHDEEHAFYERLQRKAKAHLDKFGNEHLSGLAWQSVVNVGSRAPDIVRYAKEQSSDLIILTAPIFDPHHPTWGSLSYKVVLLCPCPVLLVK